MLNRCMQEHHSEYGVHWNFFFTLTFVACLGAVCRMHGRAAGTAALTACILHQSLLSLPGVSEWLGAHERDMSSFFDANKEGLGSLCGYAALFYAGSACSALLDYKAPVDHPQCSQVTEKNICTTNLRKSSKGAGSVSSRHAKGAVHSIEGGGDVGKKLDVGTECYSEFKTSKGVKDGNLVDVLWWHARLWSAAAVLWTCVFLCDTLVQPVSRRFCNAAYVLWVTAMALTQIAAADVVLLVVAVATGVPRPPCAVTEGLSENQLLAFLLANVLTGMVNLSLDTLRAGAAQATVMMVVYCAAWGCTGLWVKSGKQLFGRYTRNV
jgi:glucosaminylphosphatidylinositol acyltransferase